MLCWLSITAVPSIFCEIALCYGCLAEFCSPQEFSDEDEDIDALMSAHSRSDGRRSAMSNAVSTVISVLKLMLSRVIAYRRQMGDTNMHKYNRATQISKHFYRLFAALIFEDFVRANAYMTTFLHSYFYEALTSGTDRWQVCWPGNAPDPSKLLTCA